MTKYFPHTLLLALIGTFVWLISPDYGWAKNYSDHQNNFIPHRVAHAGGAFNGLTLTNSIDSLDANIKKGFQYFEIDFLLTSDQEPVCLHDWQVSFEQAFGQKTQSAITLAEFQNLADKSAKFEPCTVVTLAEWMKQNPSAKIITDVKDDNLEVLGILKDALPQATTRVIPQVYSPDQFRKVKKLGFQELIWTLYRFNDTDDNIVKWSRTMTPPFAITMPERRAKSSLASRLGELGIPTYVHTINSHDLAQKYRKEAKITEIYTDFLSANLNDQSSLDQQPQPKK